MGICRWRKLENGKWGVVGLQADLIPGEEVKVYRSGDWATQKPARRICGPFSASLGGYVIHEIAPDGWKPEVPKQEHKAGVMECSCGVDTAMCQVCARVQCGNEMAWVPGRGNVCFQCRSAQARIESEFPDWTKLFDGKAVAA